MLRDLTKTDWLAILDIPPAMLPHALLLRGTRNLKTQYAHYRQFFSGIQEIGTPKRPRWRVVHEAARESRRHGASHTR